MLKVFFLSLLVMITIEAKEEQKVSFENDFLTKVTTTLDSNVTDKIKLDTMKNYLSNLQFNDKIDTNKYTFNIMGHHENFMLFGGHSTTKLTEKHWDSKGNRNNARDYQRDSNEAQFQLSIKVPLYSDFIGTGADLFTAYTQNSYWQVYDTDHSSPFRETNYMPELFLEWQPETKIGNSHLKKVRFALIHQSNGQDIGQSRSWNRTELYFLLQNKNLFYGMNIWDRWDENQKETSNAIDGDDNPGLEDYMGKQKYFVKYKNEHFNISLAHQNNIFNYYSSKGNSKIDLTFPSINSNFDFFIRYFNGYGESLIDYNVRIKRLSFGIMIADWN